MFGIIYWQDKLDFEICETSSSVYKTYFLTLLTLVYMVKVSDFYWSHINFNSRYDTRKRTPPYIEYCLWFKYKNNELSLLLKNKNK